MGTMSTEMGMAAQMGPGSGEDGMMSAEMETAGTGMGGSRVESVSEEMEVMSTERGTMAAESGSATAGTGMGTTTESEALSDQVETASIEMGAMAIETGTASSGTGTNGTEMGTERGTMSTDMETGAERVASGTGGVQVRGCAPRLQGMLRFGVGARDAASHRKRWGKGFRTHQSENPE